MEYTLRVNEGEKALIQVALVLLKRRLSGIDDRELDALLYRVQTLGELFFTEIV